MENIHILKAGPGAPPRSFDEVRALVGRNHLIATDLIWYEGCADWIEASQLPGLFDHEDSQPPAPPAAPAPASIPLEPSAASPTLWNPNVAAAWSLLFSPVFGSYLLAQNARALGRRDEAAKCIGWLWISVAFVVISVGMAIFTEHNLGFWGLVLLIVWYFSLVTKQAKFIATTYGGTYLRQPWGKPLAVALAYTAGIMFIGAMSTKQEENLDSNDPSLLESLAGVTTAQSIYDKSGEEALSEARKFFVGTWTYTGMENKGALGSEWYKFEIKADGTLHLFVAAAIANDWGKPEEHTWVVKTDKFTDTGKRYYELEMTGKRTRYTIIMRLLIERDGRLSLRIDTQPPLELKRGDVFPFSR